MAAPSGARAKARAQSYDPNQLRDARGRWRTQEPEHSWINLRSNAGSPASLPEPATSDVSAIRAKARQSSRPNSRANSISGRSVKSIPEEVEVQQEVSPVPPVNRVDDANKERSVSPVPKLAPAFDMTLNDSPAPATRNDDLMDMMQCDLDDTRSVVSNTSSTSRLYQVANGLLRAVGANPYVEEHIANGGLSGDKDVGHGDGFDDGVVPLLPFPSSDANATNAAQSATAVGDDAAAATNEPVAAATDSMFPAPVVRSMTNEPVVESTTVSRAEVEKSLHLCFNLSLKIQT